MNTTTRRQTSDNLLSSIDAKVHATAATIVVHRDARGQQYADTKIATRCGAKATGNSTSDGVDCAACQVVA